MDHVPTQPHELVCQVLYTYSHEQVICKKRARWGVLSIRKGLLIIVVPAVLQVLPEPTSKTYKSLLQNMLRYF